MKTSGAFNSAFPTPAACTHTRSAARLLLRHWLLSPKCTQDIFVSGLGWMVILCQWRGKGGECRRSQGDSQVALTPSFFLSSSFSVGQTSPHCGTSVCVAPFTLQAISVHSTGSYNKGGWWDGRKEGQTNTLGSTLFAVLFHRATQEKTKRHKSGSSVASPNPSALPRKAANTH